VLEVDAFRWSPVVEELVVGHYELLLPVFDQLMALSAAGQSMIGIAGARPGVGATTISCCLARLLVEGGKRVALVDGNLADGNLAGEGLAASLGLACEAGWADALAGNLPLAECVVYSLDDKLAVLPLSSTGAMDAGLLDSIQTSITAGVLRYHYDLVLFDLGAPAEGAQQRAAQSILNHCRLDASLVVVEPHNPVPSAPLLDLLGEGCLGSISNAAG
jgi:MinD-like ATPase involved in chromosome partitioning or flagellar assembly